MKKNQSHHTVQYTQQNVRLANFALKGLTRRVNFKNNAMPTSRKSYLNHNGIAKRLRILLHHILFYCVYCIVGSGVILVVLR